MFDILFFEMLIYEIVVIIIYIINFMVILNFIFREKRNINIILIWFFILVLIFVFGFIFYIVFGRNILKNNMFRLKEKDDKIIKSNILDI